MKYHNILHDDMRNGEGLRVVLFVSGCEHHCKGCHNPQTWDFNSGLDFTGKEIAEIADQLSKDYISGITLSGGECLHPRNLSEITNLCKWIKRAFPTKTIWCYTGYTYEEVSDLDVMNYIDVLVDGKFVEELASVDYMWAGSTNQRVIRLNEV